MNRNREDNGQPSAQTALPSDPSTSSASELEDGTCRDYVWGICHKGSQCKYRHVRNPETMKTFLKFCHDFQNRTGCTRQRCTYLHTTKAEETLFLTAGIIPKVLLERYAAANMYYNECVSQPPPPPPPLPAPLPSLLAPPPPPPPPPTICTDSMLVTPPMYTGARQEVNTAMAFPTVPDPLTIVKFDASKPPPPLPSVCRNCTIKRPAEPLEAGPSKRRKLEVVGHGVCEKCLQRELRVEVYRKDIEKLETEKQRQSFMLQQKSEEFEKGKLLLRSVVGPTLFSFVDSYIEQASSPLEQVHHVISQINQMNSLVVPGPSSSMTFQNRIMNITDMARNIVEGSRTSTFTNSPEWTKRIFLEILRNVSNSQQSSSIPPPDLAGPSRTQSTIEPQQHPLVAAEARNRPMLNTQPIPTAPFPPVQNVAHQANLAYGPTVPNLQNAGQTTTMLHPPLTHQTPMRGMHPQPNYESTGGPYHQTAAPPPPRPYYPAAYAGASNLRNSQQSSSIPPPDLAGPSRTQSTIEPQQHPLVAAEARNRPMLNTQPIPTAPFPPVQNVAHQANLAYGPTVPNLQNAGQTTTMLHPPLTHQTPMRGMHPQPNYESTGGPYHQTAAPPPPRPYYPAAYAGASNDGAAGYGQIRGLSGTSAVTTSASASAVPSQYGYIQRYPHHP